MSYLGRGSNLTRKAQDKVSFLATAGQTVRTGLSYVPTHVDVTVNGITLTEITDYTATNGNSITFSVALALNDEVTIVSSKTFDVANHYTISAANALLAAKATNTAVAAKAPIASPSFTGTVAIGHTTTTGSKFAICDGANSQIQFFPEISTDTNLTQHYDPTASAYINAETRAATHAFKTGTTERMRIDATGRVTIPNQPAFCMSVNAYSGIDAAAAGIHVIRFGNQNSGGVLFNNGNNFDTTNYRFVAPVSGFYQFNASIRIDSGSGNYLYLTMTKNGSTTAGRDLDVGVGSYVNRHVSQVLSLSANDYVDCNVRTSGDTSIGIDGDSYFSGHLIG